MKLLLLVIGIIILVLVFLLAVLGAVWATPVHLIGLAALGAAFVAMSLLPVR